MLIDGPPVASEQDPPWDWLEGVEPPQSGLVVEGQPPERSDRPLHRVINSDAAERLGRRLALPRRRQSAAVLRMTGMLVRLAERIGYLTSTDPLRTKVNWIMRRPLNS